jgi:hypothetical protein
MIMVSRTGITGACAPSMSWSIRRGILLEALSDGDAFVIFRDTKKIENVKWHHLCKVPAIDETAASGQ